MIVIINYGLGNLGSIHNMFKRIRVESVISSNLNDIQSADKLVLPGVGSFDTGMERLHQSHFIETLQEQVHVNKIPILGICLGMQLMTNDSEEGKMNGLGWIDASTKRFQVLENNKRQKIPNMGWQEVYPVRKDVLFDGFVDVPRFYFVHSYYVHCNSNEDILASSNYIHDYTCAFKRNNIYGVQFHPEKSHKYGMKLLQNFATL